MFVNEFQDRELALDDRLLRKIQAYWRGAVVRDSMRQLCRDYAAVFGEIEESPSCVIHWSLADCAVISKPQFIPVDRRKNAQIDAAKSEELINTHLKLPLVENRDNDKLQSVSLRLDGAGTPAMEFLKASVPDASMLPTCQRTDLSSMVAEEQQDAHQLDTCCLDERQNCDDVSVDQASRDNHDSAAVISSEVLRENSQAAMKSRPPAAVAGSSLAAQRHNLALELLWVQQAIHSRKQYLRLKSQLSDRDSSL